MVAQLLFILSHRPKLLSLTFTNLNLLVYKTSSFPLPHSSIFSFSLSTSVHRLLSKPRYGHHCDKLRVPSSTLSAHLITFCGLNTERLRSQTAFKPWDITSKLAQWGFSIFHPRFSNESCMSTYSMSAYRRHGRSAWCAVSDASSYA
jgi:hypothetical protein